MMADSKGRGMLAGLSTALLILLVYFLIQYAAVLIMGALDRPLSGAVLAMAVLAASAPCAAASLLLMRGSGATLMGTLAMALGRPVRGGLILWPMAALALGALHMMITMLLGRPLVSEPLLSVFSDTGPLGLFMFAVALAAPMFEELLFRGVIYGSIAPFRPGPAGAIMISSVIWAGIHFQYDLFDTGFIFLLGLLLGSARHYTGTLLAPFLMHALNNAVFALFALWHLGRL